MTSTTPPATKPRTASPASKAPGSTRAGRTTPRAVRLDRPRLVDAALRLAAHGGLAAVTARALSAELSVSPMAAYRHVENLEALHVAMLEEVIARGRVLDHAEASLPEFLEETFVRIHATLAAHPAVVPLLGTAATLGPSALTVADAVVARLLARGLSPADATRLFHHLLGFAIGSASLAAARAARVATDPPDLHALPTVRTHRTALARLGDAHDARAILRAAIRALVPT